MKFAADYLEELSRTMSGIDPAALGTAISWMKEARDAGRMVFVCGNGGSAAIASQMVTDVVKGASYGSKARFKMIGLTDSIGLITAYANDVDYESVFVEQLRNFAQKSDLLFAISGSGNSRNVLKAVEYANGIGCRTIALTRSGGGTLKDIARLTIGVPGSHMGRLEDCFFVITHIICYAFMDKAVD